jgi:hypothetical protein
MKLFNALYGSPNEPTPTEQPMTRRDWFALGAMCGAAGDDWRTNQEAAKWAYEMADAMIEAGKEPKR